jgi:hypothetical protein
MESTEVFINGWTATENIAHIKSGIWLSYEGWNPIICSNINEPVGQNVKWNKPCTEEQILHDGIHMWKIE